MNEKELKKTFEGATELLAQRVDQLHALENQAGNLLLALLRKDKSPDPPDPSRGREPDTKPTMVDVLYLIAEALDISVVRTSNILAEARSMIS